MKNFNLLLVLFCLLSGYPLMGQEQTMVLTLERAVEVARQQSPEAWYARHTFRSQYWNYCYYKANYRPSLTLTSNPNFNHSINPITLPDGTSKYLQQNETRADAKLSLTQNVPFTGGSISLQSTLNRMDNLELKTNSYRTSPISIEYQQNLLGYNAFKWERKIEPIRFEEAKKSYVETLELVSAWAINRFFNLARAQTNLEIARFNYVQADTLFIFAQGRFEIGTITENDILRLELNRLTEESNMLNAQIEVDNCMQELRAYLGISDAVPIIVSIDNEVPQLVIDADKALQLAFANHPTIEAINRRKIESERVVAQTKASTGLRADLYAQFGLTQTNEDLREAYNNLLNHQFIQVGIRLPILDWGRGKGQVRVAQSQRDMVFNREEQNESNFEQNVLKAVKQFNLQAGKVEIAAKTDQIAERSNEVARRLYLLGRSTILELNSSIVEKDAAKRGRINTLYNYWSLYYTLRSLTLYDFEKGIALTEDYESLIK